MLKPPQPPGDGRSYCDGVLARVVTYIQYQLARHRRQGRPTHIAVTAACHDLGITRATWIRYTGLLDRAGVVQRTGQRGRLPGGAKNPGYCYHSVSLKRLRSEPIDFFFLNSKTSENRTNPSSLTEKRATELTVAHSVRHSLLDSPSPTPSPREGDLVPVRSRPIAEIELLISRELARDDG